jgi:hypothetical protein
MTRPHVHGTNQRGKPSQRRDSIRSAQDGGEDKSTSAHDVAVPFHWRWISQSGLRVDGAVAVDAAGVLLATATTESALLRRVRVPKGQKKAPSMAVNLLGPEDTFTDVTLDSLLLVLSRRELRGHLARIFTTGHSPRVWKLARSRGRTPIGIYSQREKVSDFAISRPNMQPCHSWYLTCVLVLSISCPV